MRQTIANTFDGQHPCPLCHAVREGRQQEGEQGPLLGLELRNPLAILPARLEPMARPTFTFDLPPLGLAPWQPVAHPPPKPPPRPA